MFCQNCGSTINEGSKFCAICGAPQQTAAAPAQPEYPPAQPEYQPTQPEYQPEYQPAQPEYQPEYQTEYQPAQPEYQTEYPPEYQPVQPEYQTEYQPAQPEYKTEYPPEYPYSQQSAGVYTQPEYNYTQPGYPPAQTYAATPEQPYPDNYENPALPPEPVKKGKPWLKIAIPVAAVVVVAVAAIIVYFTFFQGPATLRTIDKAMKNLGGEVTQRLDGSPLKAVGMLMDGVKDGETSVDFKYNDYWSGEIKGSATLNSNLEEREFALQADLTIYGDKFDAEAYINKERMAVRSRLIDDSFYGFRYSTFRDDIKVFGELVGLDNETMDMLADVVEMIDDLMNTGLDGYEDETFNPKPYNDLLTNFIKNADINKESTSIDSGGANVKCTKIEITIPEDAIIDFLSDLVDLIADDQWIKNQFLMLDNEFLQEMAGMSLEDSYKDVLKTLRDLVRDFERDYSGDMIQTYFIGRKDRLLRVEYRWDIKFGRERTKLNASLDFGSAVTDRWVLNASVTGDDGNRDTIRITWNYTEKSSTIENTITISPGGDDPITLSSVWSPNKGDFTLSYEDSWDIYEITGIFKADNKGFELEFDDFSPPYSRDSLTISIMVDFGAQIEKIEYINLDRWGESFLEKLGDFILNSGLF